MGPSALVYRTYLEQWVIGTNGETETNESVLSSCTYIDDEESALQSRGRTTGVKIYRSA